MIYNYFETYIYMRV